MPAKVASCPSTAPLYPILVVFVKMARIVCLTQPAKALKDATRRARAFVCVGLVAFLSATVFTACTHGNAVRDVSLLLIDMDSRKPVSAARIALAPTGGTKHQKDEGVDEDECTINTSLTGLSNERGEVQIRNVHPGEYVLIQIMSEHTRPDLGGKVVTWGRNPQNAQFQLSLGPAFVTHGSLVILNGAMTISNGYMEADGLAIRTTATGRLLSLSVPGSGGAPIRMEIPNPATSVTAK